MGLRSWSARLYPDWSAALREETGIDTGYRRTGGVDVAWTDREDQALRAAAGQWRAEGIAYERLAPGDYARVEPALNPELRSVYYLPDRAQVRNPRLLRALIEAASRRGACLKPWHSVEGYAIHDGRRVDGDPDQCRDDPLRPGDRGGRSLVRSVARVASASAFRPRR